MKVIISIVLISLLVLLGVLAVRRSKPSDATTVEPPPVEHTYATWDVMEFDKCVSAWLIVRFIDKDAQFVFYPQGTEIKQGIVFDIPGAAWSRKHRKCTSDCILESLKINNPAVEKIVAMAHQTELNYWQLDQFPLARKCFDEVRGITEGAENPLECFQKTRPYFDKLYNKFKESGANDI